MVYLGLVIVLLFLILMYSFAVFVTRCAIEDYNAREFDWQGMVALAVICDVYILMMTVVLVAMGLR